MRALKKYRPWSRSWFWKAASVSLLQCLVPLHNGGVESAHAGQLVRARTEIRPQSASTSRSVIEIPEYSVTEKVDSQAFDYAKMVYRELSHTDRPLHASLDIAPGSAMETISKCQHPKRSDPYDHYDVVQIEERMEGEGEIKVTLDVWSYWKTENHSHPSHDSKEFDLCNSHRRGLENCRTIEIENIVSEVQGIDNLHK